MATPQQSIVRKSARGFHLFALVIIVLAATTCVFMISSLSVVLEQQLPCTRGRSRHLMVRAVSLTSAVDANASSDALANTSTTSSADSPTGSSLSSGNTTTNEPTRPTINALLRLGDRILQNPNDAYPDEIFAIDWSTQVDRRDILHLGALQRACVEHPNAIIPWTFALTSVDERLWTLQDAHDTTTERDLVQILSQCATVDVYMRSDAWNQGYCEDGAAYIKYIQGRILPDWVLKRTFFDATYNRTVTYHELCPNTPLLGLNHYWEDIRTRKDWPSTKPLYLMPNIEMYELNATHFRQADLVLCKTAVCAVYVTKWLIQEGNPRMTQVMYTRFTSSDVGTNALVATGVETATSAWQERFKDFDKVLFTHTSGKSMWKGTSAIIDCWMRRPDLPELHWYIDERTYATWYATTYDEMIRLRRNLHLHVEKLDAVAFGRVIADATFFLCPSEIEGYGHYINHARATGGLIVVADAPPMNELVTRTSGVVMNTTRRSLEGQFLGGTSLLPHALRNVTGYATMVYGPTVCDAIDVIMQELDPTERRQRAHRARQQFFYDTAYFADHMKQLRAILQPQNELDVS